MNLKGVVLDIGKSIWKCNDSCGFHLLVLGWVRTDEIGGIIFDDPVYLI